MSIKSSSFKKANACVTKRNSSKITANSRATRGKDEAIIARDIITAYLRGEYKYANLAQLKEDVLNSYTVVNDVEETQEKYAEQLAGQINRLIRAIKGRSAIVLDDPMSISIDEFVTTQFPEDDDIDVTDMTYIYDEYDSKRKMAVVEGVCIKKGVPWLSATRRGKKHPGNEIPMYLMIRALRDYVDENFDEGEDVEICASYWFLKKQSDTTKARYIDPYFGAGCPARTLSEIYIAGSNDDPTKATKESLDNDDKFRKLIDQWVAGIDAEHMDSCKDCRGCVNEPLCSYQPVPVLEEEAEKTVKVRPAVELTEEQRKIVETRDGINICIAPPGSGKTETAIKERTVSIVLSEIAKMEERYLAGEDVIVSAGKLAEFGHQSDRGWD